MHWLGLFCSGLWRRHGGEPGCAGVAHPAHAGLLREGDRQHPPAVAVRLHRPLRSWVRTVVTVATASAALPSLSVDVQSLHAVILQCIRIRFIHYYYYCVFTNKECALVKLVHSIEHLTETNNIEILRKSPQKYYKKQLKGAISLKNSVHGGWESVELNVNIRCSIVSIGGDHWGSLGVPGCCGEEAVLVAWGSVLMDSNHLPEERYNHILYTIHIRSLIQFLWVQCAG